MKNTAQGFTLMELLVTVALLSMFIIPILFGIQRTGQTQNIRTTVSVLSDDLQTVKVSAREARDKSSWGIITTSANSYQIVKGDKVTGIPVSNRTLEHGVTFENQFVLWFTIGTGSVNTEQQITLTNLSGQRYQITVNELGTISAQLL